MRIARLPGLRGVVVEQVFRPVYDNVELPLSGAENAGSFAEGCNWTRKCAWKNIFEVL